MATPLTPQAFEQWMRGIESRIAQVEKRDPFINTAFSIPGPGVTAVAGALESPNYSAGSAGYALTQDGNAEFNAITLRAGIIGNDALTNPVVPGFLFNSINTFGLSPTLTNIQTVNVTVPAGCTRLSAVVIGRVYAINNTTGLDYLYAQTNIAGYNGNALPLAVSANNGSGTNVSPFAVLLTGLTPGGTVAVQMAAQTSFGSWSSSSNNISELTGLLSWFR